MSIVVSTVTTGGEMETARRSRLRWRVTSVIGCMVFMGGLAAVPLPIWQAKEDLEWRADELRAWIESTTEQERELSSWNVAREQRTLDVASLAERWLGAEDPLAVRGLILDCAHGCGLDVTSVKVDGDGANASSGGGAVLGRDRRDDGWTAQSVGGLQLERRRYVVRGRGDLPSLLLFCGALRGMPHPLRLRSVELTELKDTHEFTVIAEKLLSPTSAARQGGG